jgi:uncharacterized membrane protein YfcA
MLILLTMIAVGVILGFTGAGGSGFVIAVLITFFEIPLHTALGTSMIAMIFTVIAGSYSHFKEGNVSVPIGITVGMFAALGTYTGTFIARSIPADTLTYITAGLLFISSFLIWLRTRIKINEEEEKANKLNRKIVGNSSWTGGMIGIISGTCGLGSAPMIQVSLLTIMKLDIVKVAGTTMLIIIPIAIFGGLGFYSAGFFSLKLLFQIVIGTAVGSYFGAKFTKRAHKELLRFAMVYTPALSGLLMLLFSF